ncbi:MAG: hypothetical protein U0Q18_08680 [Bryobacteraceae bacterium]
MKVTLLSAAVLLPASMLWAQTAQTGLFRAAMNASNESPQAAGGASGAADVAVHVVRDSNNNIISGSVDISVGYEFAGDTTVTGLGIVNAPAGHNGTTVIATNLSASAPLLATGGRGRIYRQVQIGSGNSAGLAALTGMLTNAGGYSVNLTTSASPAGAMSGTLQSGNLAVVMAQLSSANATGTAAVLVLYTGQKYAIGSGIVYVQTSYRFSSQVTFSAVRIYAGQGTAGKLVIPMDLQPGTLSDPSGSGILSAPGTEIDMTNTQMVQAVQNMMLAPGGFSANISTVENPSAPLSGTLRLTDSMTFQIPGEGGSGGASEIFLHTLRSSSGQVVAGTLIFDVNYRLPAGTPISGLDIDGTIQAPAITADPSGSGNVFVAAIADNTAALASLNDLVGDPEAHHINLQPAGSGAISAPVAQSNTNPAVIAAVIPIVEDKNLATFAPGELVEIYGTNLSKVTGDLSGWPGGSLPQVFNGVSVTLGGQAGRILYVSPFQVDAAFAFETPTGSQALTLNNGNGDSAPMSINVQAIAPAIYPIVFKNANFSLIGSSNPAKAGDVIVLYATGMGQTTPVLTTGEVVPAGPPFFNTAPVTVSIGGKNAGVIYSIAAPPYVAGLYQMAVTVPSGLGPGTVAIVASAGGLNSNTVSIPVQ